jgi:hypothetical protein
LPQRYLEDFKLGDVFVSRSQTLGEKHFACDCHAQRSLFDFPVANVRFPGPRQKLIAAIIGLIATLARSVSVMVCRSLRSAPAHRLVLHTLGLRTVCNFRRIRTGLASQ